MTKCVGSGISVFFFGVYACYEFSMDAVVFFSPKQPCLRVLIVSIRYQSKQLGQRLGMELHRSKFQLLPVQSGPSVVKISGEEMPSSDEIQ